MGCRLGLFRKSESFVVTALVPDFDDSDPQPHRNPPAGKDIGERIRLLSAQEDCNLHTVEFEEEEEVEEQKEEDLGNSDDDEWLDETSSGTDPGLPPETKWAKQVRRELRQTKRRQRALRRAKRAPPKSKSNLVEEPCHSGGELLELWYRVGERLGRGSYASVSRCTHLPSKAERALKRIDLRRSAGEEQVREEVAIMRMVSHPYVIKLYETFEDRRYVYIVMELLLGGELFDLVANAAGGQGLGEEESARGAAQIASAVRYLHSVQVAHRDLKLENVMLTRPGEDLSTATLKVIDFNLSRRFEPGSFMCTWACTPQYVAPEVLERRYTELCDIWSLGVMIYVLLSGTTPFSGANEAEILQSVKSGRYEFEEQRWAGKSAAPKDLIRQMLLVDPARRFRAEQVVAHPWLDDAAPYLE